MEYVCAWSLHKVGTVLDKASLWLEEGEREILVERPSSTYSEGWCELFSVGAGFSGAGGLCIRGETLT